MEIDLSTNSQSAMKHNGDCKNDTMFLSGVDNINVSNMWNSTPKISHKSLSNDNFSQTCNIHYESNLYKYPVHVEVCVSPLNCQEFSYIESYVVQFLRHLGPRHVPATLNCTNNDFNAISGEIDMEKVIEVLNNSVSSINLILNETDGAGGDDAGRSVDLRTVSLLVHVYQLVNGDEGLPVNEMIEFNSESINGGTTWLLPSTEMHGLWESLVFDSDLKLKLLQYSQTALLFADHEVSSSVISWNRVVLLYGPPGTGKTSICRALANKLAIRLAHRYSSTQLIEINTMNLMSKWFSESARLIARMFDTIKEYLESPDHLVCLLVDEVESLTVIRTSSMSGCEPSDAIRVVNAVLTQIDQIKRYPNILILATSNVTGVIDPAFLDRADLRLFLGPPSASAIYTIYRSCLNELTRVGLINSENEHERLVSYQSLKAMQFSENKDNALSLKLWRLSEQSETLNGRTLRKLPLLAYAFYLQNDMSNLGTNPFSTNNRLDLSKSNSKHVPKLSHSMMMMDEENAPIISLDLFIDALKLCVEAHFAEVKALDAASVGKCTRLT